MIIKHMHIFVFKNEGKLNELSQDLKDSLKNLKTSKAKTHTISINQLAIIKIEKMVNVLECLTITRLIFLNIL